MKNKKNILALALATAIFSLPAMAESQPDFLSDSKSEFKAETGLKLDLTNSSSSDKEVKSAVKVKASESGSIKSYSDVEAFVDPEISVDRSAEISEKQHELQMLKLDIQAAEIRSTLAKMKEEENKATIDELVKARKAVWEKERSDLVSDYESQIESLKSEVSKVKTKLEEDNEVRDFLNEKLFVTKTYGIGSNKKALFYFENNIKTVGVGGEIIPGAKVVSIDNNGAVVSYKGKSAPLTITTKEYAYSKTISREEIEYQKQLESARAGVISVPSDISNVPPLPY